MRGPVMAICILTDQRTLVIPGRAFLSSYSGRLARANRGKDASMGGSGSSRGYCRSHASSLPCAVRQCFSANVCCSCGRGWAWHLGRRTSRNGMGGRADHTVRAYAREWPFLVGGRSIRLVPLGQRFLGSFELAGRVSAGAVLHKACKGQSCLFLCTCPVPRSAKKMGARHTRQSFSPGSGLWLRTHKQTVN